MADLAELPGTGADQMRRWLSRLDVDGTQHLGIPVPPAPDPLADRLPYERALALWDRGSADDLLTALTLLDDLDARAAGRAGPRASAGARDETSSPWPAVRPRGPNLAGLTERQLDVLALLDEGLSNADIAARLVISLKTADHHVSAILGQARRPLAWRGGGGGAPARAGRAAAVVDHGTVTATAAGAGHPISCPPSAGRSRPRR